jgi:hypothetical protein
MCPSAGDLEPSCVLLQGARNERRLVAVCCSNSSTFEIIHGLLNRVMEVLGVPVRLPGQGASSALAVSMAVTTESRPGCCVCQLVFCR